MKPRDLPADLVREWAAKRTAAPAKLERDPFMDQLIARANSNLHRGPLSKPTYGRSQLNADGTVCTVLYDD